MIHFLTSRIQTWVWLFLFAAVFGGLYLYMRPPDSVRAITDQIELAGESEKALLKKEHKAEIEAVKDNALAEIEKVSVKVSKVEKAGEKRVRKAVTAMNESDAALASRIGALAGVGADVARVSGDSVTIPRKVAVALVESAIRTTNQIEIEKAKCEFLVIEATRDAVIKEVVKRNTVEDSLLAEQIRARKLQAELTFYKQKSSSDKMDKIVIGISVGLGALLVGSLGTAVYLR